MTYAFVLIVCLLLVFINLAIYGAANEIYWNWKQGLIGLVISLLIMYGGYILGRL